MKSNNISEKNKNKVKSLVPQESIDILRKQYPKNSKDEITSLIIRYGAPKIIMIWINP